MPIKDALQLAYALAEQKLRGQHVGHGSDQILGGHLVDRILREEQADLRRALQFREALELSGGPAPDAAQVGFSQSLRLVA